MSESKRLYTGSLCLAEQEPSTWLVDPPSSPPTGCPYICGYLRHAQDPFLRDGAVIMYPLKQCCGSGSSRIRTFLPDPDLDPEISPPNPDLDPALVVFKQISVSVLTKKYLFLCNIVHMYIYLLRRCDSSIGIGKATQHHEFDNDEIGFCLVS
jgi:hypothetical protein